MSEEISRPAPDAAPPHGHRDGERCTAPGPWFSFGLTAGLAAVLAVLVLVIRALL